MRNLGARLKRKNRQHRTIPALRLKHRSGSCGTASALPKCSIMSGCGTRIVLRGQKPLALCDRCPCFGSLFPPLAALTFAASSIICAFGLASAAPRSPYRHLELCGIAVKIIECLPYISPRYSPQSNGRTMCAPTVYHVQMVYTVRRGRTPGHLLLRLCRNSPCRTLRYGLCNDFQHCIWVNTML